MSKQQEMSIFVDIYTIRLNLVPEPVSCLYVRFRDIPFLLFFLLPCVQSFVLHPLVLSPPSSLRPFPSFSPHMPIANDASNDKENPQTRQ